MGVEFDNYFEHVQNIYDNNNYYFLHIGDSFGKRVSISQAEEVENHEVNFFTERKFHEWEDQNLKNTGRQWFGEYFYFNELYTINFNFSNRIMTESVRINARAVARSETSTSLDFAHNGNEILSVPIGTQISAEIYVDDGEGSNEFTSMDNSISMFHSIKMVVLPLLHTWIILKCRQNVSLNTMADKWFLVSLLL